MSKYRLLLIEEGRYLTTKYNTKEYLEELFSETSGWCYTDGVNFLSLKDNRVFFEIVEVPDDVDF